MALEYHRDGLPSDEDYEAYAQSILQLFESSVVMEWREKDGQFVLSQRFRDLVSESYRRPTTRCNGPRGLAHLYALKLFQ